MKRILKISAILALSAIVLFGVLLLYIAVWPVQTSLPGSKDLAVVFGAGITRNGEPSAALFMRLQKAATLYEARKVKTILVSGRIAEVFVMKTFLVKNHVRPEDVQQDPEGENTSSTVFHAARWIRTNRNSSGVVFISQRYHIPRIRLLAWKYQVPGVVFLAADTRRISNEKTAVFMVREAFAFLKDTFVPVNSK